MILASLVLVFTACKEEMGKINNQLSSVKTLIEPAHAKSIVLLTNASATMYFEWEVCKWDNSGTALYQIAFDKASGDFSNPVYVVNSDNNGYKNSVSISHKQMNTIGGMMGIGAF